MKSMIKSSSEKDKENERNPSEAVSDSAKREERVQLKSTNSARNLFGGREIFSQLTEFCSELKKLALNGSDREVSTTKSTSRKSSEGVEKEEEPSIEEEKAALVGVKEKSSAKIFSPDAWRRKKK